MSQALKTDKVQFTVVARNEINGLFSRVNFDTFASAAGHASALKGVVLINAEFYSPDSSWSATMYIYGKDGVRRVGSQAMVNAVTSFEKSRIV